MLVSTAIMWSGPCLHPLLPETRPPELKPGRPIPRVATRILLLDVGGPGRV